MASTATTSSAAASVSSAGSATFITNMNMNMGMGLGMGMSMGLSVNIHSAACSSSSTTSSPSASSSTSSCSSARMSCSPRSLMTPRRGMTTPTAVMPTGKIPKFLRSLYSILQTEDPTIVAWVQNQELKPNRVTAFHILNMPRFEKEVLPKYFKHQKFASFQRQLNNFGFRKWTKTQSSGVCTFSHNCFPPDPMHLSSLKASVREHWRQGIKKPVTPKQLAQGAGVNSNTNAKSNSSSNKKTPSVTTANLTPLQLEEASRPHATTTHSSLSTAEMVHPFQDCPLGSQISPARKARLCPDLTSLRMQRGISPMDSSMASFCSSNQENSVVRHPNASMVGMSISDLLVQDHHPPLSCSSGSLGALNDPMVPAPHESHGTEVGSAMISSHGDSSSFIHCDSFLKGMEELESTLDARNGDMMDTWASVHSAKRADGFTALNGMQVVPNTLTASTSGAASSFAPSSSTGVDFGFPLVELDWNDTLLSCHQDRALPSSVENDYAWESLLFVE